MNTSDTPNSGKPAVQHTTPQQLQAAANEEVVVPAEAAAVAGQDQAGPAADEQAGPVAAAAAIAPAPPPAYDVRWGIFEFHSTNARAMLLEYENINRLLGPTNDDTAPGTHCELLLRNFLRQHLPQRYSVDKGFIFGRRIKDNEEVHSPEIDLLIHNTELYQPIFRLEDFVIVVPHAVCGVIQVKRTLTSGQLQKAIDNLIEAKRHIQECAIPDYPGVQLDRVYSAAVFFADTVVRPQGGAISQTYRNRLQKAGVANNLRPHFAGSLSFRYYLRWGANRDQYNGFSSHFFRDNQEHNAALVALLGDLSSVILPAGTQPPLYFPPNYLTNESFPTEPNQ